MSCDVLSPLGCAVGMRVLSEGEANPRSGDFTSAEAAVVQAVLTGIKWEQLCGVPGLCIWHVPRA